MQQGIGLLSGGYHGPMPYLSQVADLPVLEFDTSDVSRSTMLLKRCFDVIVSAAGLLLFVPLFPLMALAIRLDSPGPAIFSQLRAGLGGRPFRMYKLRSMYRDAEDQLSDLVDLDALPEPAFKLRDDPRVTRVGRLLRRLSLDELPQLWNVLRGDMSIVGPRPEELALVARYQPEHRFRLQVKPGMTGPMQVSGRGELAFAERLAVELDYVERVSLARDLFPYVVADLDYGFRGEAAQVLRVADVVLLVLRLDFSALRHTQRALEYLNHLGVGPERVRLVANCYGRPKEVPAGKAEEALGVKIFHYVPDDPKTVNRANNSGVPLVIESPWAKVSRSLSALAHGINGRHQG